MAISPLPAFFSAPRLSARAWLALAGGIGAGTAAYAGLYPRFDNLELHTLVAVTAAPFGAGIVAWAVSARSAARAFGRTFAASMILGMACTVAPGLLLAKGDVSLLPFVLLFGGFFGAPTGMAYGVLLGALAASGQRRVAHPSHASTDGAARVGAWWLAGVTAFAIATTATYDVWRAQYGEIDQSILVSMLGPVFALEAIVLVLAFFVAIRATVRSHLRSAWLARVRAGQDPAFRVRPMDGRDPLGTLPMVEEGTSVVEWRTTNEPTTAYRVPAEGIAVAIVGDISA